MKDQMAGDRELDTPVDFPNGTTAIVKVQRPPDNRGKKLSWVVFAQGPRHFRTYKEHQLPIWLVDMMSIERKLYVHAKVRDGEWQFLSVASDQLW